MAENKVLGYTQDDLGENSDSNRIIELYLGLNSEDKEVVDAMIQRLSECEAKSRGI